MSIFATKGNYTDGVTTTLHVQHMALSHTARPTNSDLEAVVYLGDLMSIALPHQLLCPWCHLLLLR